MSAVVEKNILIAPAETWRTLSTEKPGKISSSCPTLGPGIDLPEHSHPHDQITNIIEGEFELTVDGVPEILSAGHYRVIPPDVVHSGRSITVCRIIDVFSPVREDYR